VAREGDPERFEIPPGVVRAIARSRPEDGDHRARFRDEQPWLSSTLYDRLGGEGELGAELGHSLGAALWAMYDQALESWGFDRLEAIEASRLDTFLPIARELLSRLGRERSAEGATGEPSFDPEWLADLPRGAQPHVMGFLIGALRAARLRLTPEEIVEAAAILFALAGALESAAMKTRPEGDGDDGGQG
jgi:hypothetical protein